jgi:hypothetical protein
MAPGLNPILFQLNGALPDDRYLPGQFHWPLPVLLSAVLLNGHPPVAGTLTLTLEVGGVATASSLTITPATVFPLEMDLSRTVPAGSFVRWRAAFTGGAGNAAAELGLTVTVAPAPAATASEWTVVWVSGPEQVVLWNYDPATRQFTPADTFLPDRASLVQTSADVSFFIGATEALRVAGGIFYARSFTAVAAYTRTAPKLLFCQDGNPLASLTATEFCLANLTEDVPVAGGPQFEFWADAVLVAGLNLSGMTALGLSEDWS